MSQRGAPAHGDGRHARGDRGCGASSASPGAPGRWPPCSRDNPTRCRTRRSPTASAAWSLRPTGSSTRTGSPGPLRSPPDATLMGLDLNQLRAKVLADAQVSTGGDRPELPGHADGSHLRALAGGAHDGPVGRAARRRCSWSRGTGSPSPESGFDPAMVETLPWLDGIKLSRAARGLAPIEGMRPVSDLLRLGEARGRESLPQLAGHFACAPGDGR